MTTLIFDASMPSSTPSIIQMSRSIAATEVSYYIAGLSVSGTLAVPGFLAMDEFQVQFENLARTWHDETAHLSSPMQIAMHHSYQRIIGMGDKAVPLILHDLRKRGGQWYWALDAITNANPAPPEAAGDMFAIRNAWVDWGHRQGYLVN